MRGQIKKILIFSPNWIGDTIMSIPLVSSLKKAFPSLYIVMLAKPYVSSLWKEDPSIDELWSFNAPRIYEDIQGYLRLLKQIKKYNFDLTIILPHYFRWAFITYLAGIRNRIGYDVRHRGLFLTTRLKYNLKELSKTHMVENYLDIARAIGVESYNKELVLNIDTDGYYDAKRILEENKIEPKDLVVGIAPGAIYGPAKRWPIKRYAELADNVIERYNAKIIIFIGPKEKALAHELKSFMHYNPFIFTGKDSLLQVAALIKRCGLFITNDSGLMHIAAAVKTEIIAIFGSTSPVWTRPYGSNHLIVKKETDCSPCFRRKCSYNTFHCLSSITIEDVLEAVDIQLRRKINRPIYTETFKVQ